MSNPVAIRLFTALSDPRVIRLKFVVEAVIATVQAENLEHHLVSRDSKGSAGKLALNFKMQAAILNQKVDQGNYLQRKKPLAQALGQLHYSRKYELCCFCHCLDSHHSHRQKLCARGREFCEEFSACRHFMEGNEVNLRETSHVEHDRPLLVDMECAVHRNPNDHQKTGFHIVSLCRPGQLLAQRESRTPNREL
jgi:hypothetical protein